MGLLQGVHWTNFDWASFSWNDVIPFLQGVIAVALGLAGLVAVFFIVNGTYGYFTSFGDPKKAEGAKKSIMWALVGVLIITLSYFFVGVIWSFFTNNPMPPELQTPATPASSYMHIKTQSNNLVYLTKFHCEVKYN